jgi:hypothetical protein
MKIINLLKIELNKLGYRNIIKNMDSITEMFAEFDIKDESVIQQETMDDYTCFNESLICYENNEHYSSLMCLKDTMSGPRRDESSDKYMVNANKLGGRANLKHKCVLPIGHIGKCSHNFGTLFKKNDITDKLKASTDTAIYYTPGNDDYVYKNRALRLFENSLSSSEEKKLRDKTCKKKCAIPLKDTSSPILMAQAYLDWITYMVNIKGITEHINDTVVNRDILSMLNKNKEHLITVFSQYNRKVFDSDGHSICVIKQRAIELCDVSDPTRDNRTDISENDIQLGHNYPRSEKYASIRGENLIPMSRRGNLIIGERIFTQDIWIDELKRIVGPY